MNAYRRNTEVEFRHEKTQTEIQRGSRNRRESRDRRGAKCGHRRSNRVSRPRRNDSVGSLSQAPGKTNDQYAFASNTEVEFRHEKTQTEIQRGSRNRRNGGNRRRADCGHPASDRPGGPWRRYPPGSSSEELGEGTHLPVEIEPAAYQQLEEAIAWWQFNRFAAPNAIREDFESMAGMLARNPTIGSRSTNAKTSNVRQVFLPRVGYFVYYRVTGSPQTLQILAFWHARSGKGPPI